MKIAAWVLCLVMGLCAATKQVEASARQFYLELLAAIDRAEVKARLGLDTGTWRSTVGDTEITWIIRTKDGSSTSAVTNLDYSQGLLQHGQIIFEVPITAVVKRSVGGQLFCVVMLIKRIDYSEQGYIEPSSDLKPQPPSPDCNARAGRSELQRVASVSDDIQDVFSGRTFRGMGKLGRTVRCIDSKCTNTKPDTGPINRVQLLGTTNIVKLLGGKAINFPTGGYIKTDSGSQLKIATLDYDVSADGVEGQIDDTTLKIADGRIKAGITDMTFSGGGSITNAGIKFVKTGGAIAISGGMEVALGPNTLIDLVTHPRYPSQIRLDRAKAMFSDLQISFSGSAVEIGARYADLKDIQVQGAIIGFSESNSLSIGPTQFAALLGRGILRALSQD
jgi:hypothetical protein